MKSEIKKFYKIYPWFSGLSSDLLFWIVIDTLFLTTVKGFSASEVVSFASVSILISMLVQIPLYKLIKRIGNENSVKLGSLLLLLGSITLTLGTNYFILVLGKSLVEIAFSLQNMSNAILRNNLNLDSQGSSYIKIQSRGNTIYAVITMIISLFASILFNMNAYLPMIFCILSCVIVFILSFQIKEYSNDKNSVDDKKNEVEKGYKKKYSKILILTILFYGIILALISEGQGEGKLLIQYELATNFTIENTAIILGIIIFISRIFRVGANVIFEKIHNKIKPKVIIAIPIILIVAILLILIGAKLDEILLVKYITMSLGYIIILFIRDPIRIYIQDIALKITEKKNQQSVLVLLAFLRKLFRTILGLIFSAILVNYELDLVLKIVIGLISVQIITSIVLYIKLKNQNI